MFERYTEKARRVIFFARYEASAFGSSYIETEHLLLGLLREDKAITHKFLQTEHNIESIRQKIRDHYPHREFIPTNVDMPLSNEGKRALAYSAEEADALGHKYIGTEHMLLGLLREEKAFAAVLLRNLGLRLSTVREELKETSQRKAQEFAEGHMTSFLLLEDERMAVEAANARDAGQLLSFYCDDALLILPNISQKNGKPEIHAWINALMANKSVKFTYRNVHAEVSGDGSLGYTTSEYQSHIVRQDDSVSQEVGHWVQIWRREGDKWKIAVAIASNMPIR